MRRMCGASLNVRHGGANHELEDRVSLECISMVMWRGRLRWFGHVERFGDFNWVNVRPGGVRVCNEELSVRVGLECCSVVVRSDRLRWFGHALSKI